VSFEVILKESSDYETLIAVSIWFQICGAAEEKAYVQRSQHWENLKSLSVHPCVLHRIISLYDGSHFCRKYSKTYIVVFLIFVP